MQSKQEIFDSIPICIKRGPYIEYKKFPDTVDKVLFILRNYEAGDIDKITKKTGFKRRTMYDWLSRIKEDQTYNPLDKHERPISRIFTEEEDIIVLSIFHNELAKGKCFCDMDAIEILTDVYIQKHADDEEFDTTFDVSNGYIYILF